MPRTRHTPEEVIDDLREEETSCQVLIEGSRIRRQRWIMAILTKARWLPVGL